MRKPPPPEPPPAPPIFWSNGTGPGKFRDNIWVVVFTVLLWALLLTVMCGGCTVIELQQKIAPTPVRVSTIAPTAPATEVFILGRGLEQHQAEVLYGTIPGSIVVLLYGERVNDIEMVYVSGRAFRQADLEQYLRAARPGRVVALAVFAPPKTV